MDGLLIDSEPLWQKAFAEAFAPLGIKPTPADWIHHQGRGINESIEYYEHTYGWDKAVTNAELQQVIIKDMVGLVKKEGKLRPGVHNALKVCDSAALPKA